MHFSSESLQRDVSALATLHVATLENRSHGQASLIQNLAQHAPQQEVVDA